MKLVRFKLIINSLNPNRSYLTLLIRVYLLFCFLFLLNSCKSVKKTDQSKSPSLQITSPKIEHAKGEYHPSETLKNDLLHTKLEVSFNWEKQYLNGIATLTFKPYFYPQDSLILDAKGMDVHEVKLVTPSVVVGADGVKFSTTEINHKLIYSYDQKLLKIKLDKTYSRKDTFLVSIKYTAKPNELPKGGSQAITSDIGLYFINPVGKDGDKPQQIWTQGETEASSCWFPTIDSPNEKTTQEMYITVENNFTVLSNGRFMSSINNKNGTKTEYWKQELPHAPYLFMMAIGEFAVVKDKWRNLEVSYYVEPKYEKYAKAIFGHTPEMMEFFSTRLGYKYPWAKYSQVVVRDYVSGAMENTSATIFMEALQSDERALADDNWETIIAHELFHHWFGDLVTCESWSNLPLNESFANYSEYLWMEHKHGVDAADHHGENEAEEYYDEATRKQVPLIRYRYIDKEDMFDRHSYNKGGRILHMLRKYVGDEAFFESLRRYLSTHEYKPVEVHDLRLAFEQVTGQDLNWFFNQWFLSSGHPELKVNHTYSSGLLQVSVKQTQDTLHTPVYRLPVKMDIWVNGIKTTHSIMITKSEQVFEIPVMAQPNLVLFDSELQLLGKIDHEKSIEELVFQYKNYDRYLARRYALENLFSDNSANNTSVSPQKKETVAHKSPFENPQVKEILSASLGDSFWAIRNIALDQFSIYPMADFSKYLSKIENIALSDSKPPVRAKAINLLSSYSNKEYIHVYKKALNEQISYSVIGAGLSGYLRSGDQSMNLNLEEYEHLDNIYIVLPLGSYYLSSGTNGKYDWFKQKLAKGSPRIIYNLLGLFANYSKTLDGSLQDDAKAVLKNIAENNRYEQIRYQAQMYLDELNEKPKE